MRIRDALGRITGISTPVGGVSWTLGESDKGQAKKVVSFLEDRRVLFAPDSLEVLEQCVESVLEIRRFLTLVIGELTEDSRLEANLKLMRNACRKFLDSVQPSGGRELVVHASERGHYASWTFYSALGELRGIVGLALALMGETFDLDIERNLAQILPRLD